MSARKTSTECLSVFVKTEAVPCGPNDYCWKRDEWQSSGTHTVYWYGTDDTGTLRPDLNHVAVASFRTNFAQNAVLVFGAAPAAGNASVSAPVFNPAAGPPLTMSFDVTYYLNNQQPVWVSFVNVRSGSTLKTIQVTNLIGGHATVTWDGRADNGMLVAPGDYKVLAIFTDPTSSKYAIQLPLIITY